MPRPNPPKLPSEEALYQYALRALMRRAHSVFEMRQALERRAEEKAAARRVLQRLKQAGFLDDARYAAQFARYRAESRRQGRYRIARELRARGVAQHHIEAALAAVFAELDEAALVRQRLARRLRRVHGPLDRRKLASLYRSLLHAGFSADIIRDELRSLSDRADLPETQDFDAADESDER